LSYTGIFAAFAYIVQSSGRDSEIHIQPSGRPLSFHDLHALKCVSQQPASLGMVITEACTQGQKAL
jgi:hypothetical protein